MSCSTPPMHQLLTKEILWLHALPLVHCVFDLFPVPAGLSTNSHLEWPRDMAATRSDVRQYGRKCVNENECPWSHLSHGQYVARCQHATTLSSPQCYVLMTALRGFLRQLHEVLVTVSSLNLQCFLFPHYTVRRNSSVSIANHYWLDGLGIEARWGARFSTPV
jgi:hypothetical protein